MASYHPKISFNILFILVGISLALFVQNSICISQHPILIVISYDGFRFDYLNKTSTPTLDELARNGLYAEYMRPVFPTYTFPNHQSIATGLYSASHGVVDNTVYDSLYNRSLSGFSDDPGFWNYNSDVKPIWILNEEAGGGRVSGTFMWPGSGQGYGEHSNLVPRFYRHYDESVSWEDRVQTVISWIKHEHYPTNLIFMYFNEPDSTGHAIGPNDPNMLIEIQRCDDRTKYFVDSLKAESLFDQVSFMILSDHGMESVPESNVIGMAGIINTTYFQRQGGSVISQIGPREGRYDEVYNAFLNASKVRNFTLRLRDELDEFNYVNSRRVMEIVLIADPGYSFNFSKQFSDGMPTPTPGEKVIGVHGYDNKHPAMRPFFLAHGPLFKSGVVVQPFDNVDLFSLFSKIAGINEAQNNGSYQNVEGMLFHEETTTSSDFETTTPNDLESTMVSKACSIINFSQTITLAKIWFLIMMICYTTVYMS